MKSGVAIKTSNYGWDIFAYPSATVLAGYTKNDKDLNNKLLPVKLAEVFNRDGVGGEVEGVIR